MQIGKPGLAVLGLALLLLAKSPVSAEPPAVVVSIKPVHSLVAAVMAEVGEPTLLVRGAASPHSYSLRPSAARALDRAGLVFWVGEDFETFLIEPLEALSDKAKVVELAALPGIRLLEARKSGAWEAHAQEGEGAHDHEAGHHAAQPGETRGFGEEWNQHLWLDPGNAKVIVEAAARALGDLDPANADRYRANAKTAVARLAALDDELKAALAPVKEVPFVVFHDAYQYFEAHYGLNAVGSISVSEGRAPGAKRLRELREKIAETGARCVFVEPQFEPALVATVIEGTQARTGVLDPIGADLNQGPEAYAEILRGLAAALNKCLAPQS